MILTTLAITTLDIAAYGLAACGVLIIAMGLFRDRARGRARCPKCYFILDRHEFNKRGTLTCSECGRIITSDRQLRRTRRSWKVAALGIPLILGGLLYPKMSRDGAASVLPVRVLTWVDRGGALEWLDLHLYQTPPTHWVALEIQRRQFLFMSEGAQEVWMAHVAQSLAAAGEQNVAPDVRALHDRLASTTIDFDWSGMLPSDVAATVDATFENAQPFEPRPSLDMQVPMTALQALELQMSSLQFEPRVPRRAWSSIDYVDGSTIAGAATAAATTTFRRVYDLAPLIDVIETLHADEELEAMIAHAPHTDTRTQVLNLCTERARAGNNAALLLQMRWLVVAANSYDHLMLQTMIDDLVAALSTGADQRAKAAMNSAIELAERLDAMPCPLTGPARPSAIIPALRDAGITIVVDDIAMDTTFRIFENNPITIPDGASFLDALNLMDYESPITGGAWDLSYGAVVFADDRAVDLVYQTYDVASLMSCFTDIAWGGPTDQPVPRDRVHTLVRTFVFPRWWSRLSGTRGLMHLVGDTLLVRASPRLHLRVESFLDRLEPVLNGRWEAELEHMRALRALDPDSPDADRFSLHMHDCGTLGDLAAPEDNGRSLITVLAQVMPNNLDYLNPSRNQQRFEGMGYVPGVLLMETTATRHFFIADLLARMKDVTTNGEAAELARLDGAPDEHAMDVAVFDLGPRDIAMMDNPNLWKRVMQRLLTDIPRTSWKDMLPGQTIAATTLGHLLLVRAPVRVLRAVPAILDEIEEVGSEAWMDGR